jgi:DNA-binding transcriptional regulator YdaS (Cro superfamily)
MANRVLTEAHIVQNNDAMLEATIPLPPLEVAIEILGGVSEMAKRIDVSPSAITNWRARGRVPPERCRAIETLTKGKVTRRDLRPDVF